MVSCRTRDMTKRESNKLDRRYDAAFKAHGNCVQFNIMDLGKMRNEVRTAVIAGADLDEAMKAAVAKYRKN